MEASQKKFGQMILQGTASIKQAIESYIHVHVWRTTES